MELYQLLHDPRHFLNRYKGIHTVLIVQDRSVMPQFAPDAIEQNQKLLDLIRTVAEGKHATPGQVALAWILCKKPYLVPIPGTRKSV